MNNTYRLIETREIPEYSGTGCLYEHVQTGAKVFTLKNDDKNKVFLIGFRTTPKDSTGVAHIMEHSVLCGSAKYPIKDPFVELAKGSLNTFLNAMTYPDKTVYPVASVNDKDFMNLMDVYLDSVFHPNVYMEPKIFRQEGWHYELENAGTPEEELRLNGVVYNEMKGAFSNPDSVLERYTLRSLFPDTTYANESGGLPSDIPELSYEEFLDFHRRYYHPSNSYIYLYGDMDMEEKLEWIDENYLNEYERISIDSHIDRQQPYAETKFDKEYYAVGANEPLEHKTYLSENFVIDDAQDQETLLAWEVLEFVLLSSPGAVLREALIKAGIGEDIYGGYSGEIRQPYFTVIAKNTDEDKLELFRRIIRDTLTDLVERGISKKSLTAALNFLEFKYREGDFGTMPQGLSLGLGMFGSWLYDESPYTYLYYNDAFASLKNKIDSSYFEDLIRTHILENRFSAVAEILPKQGLTDEEDTALKKKLADYKDSLSAAEKEDLALETLALKAYQQEPDTPFNIAKLPVLQISDIDKEADHVNARREGDIIWSEADTHGIAYMRILFDTSGLSEEELQYASFLKDIFSEMDTTEHSYSDLFDEILLNTGGISFSGEAYASRDDAGSVGYKGIVSAELRTLKDKIAAGFALAEEMINHTILDDPERMMELILEAKSRMQVRIDSTMHMTAVVRASSYFSDTQRYSDLVGGIAYNDFVNAVSKATRDEEEMKRFIGALQSVGEKLFTRENVSFALYGDAEMKAAMEKAAKDFKEKLREGGETCFTGSAISAVGYLNEGFKSSSQVNYVARCGNYAEAGLPYNGALQVLRMMLNYEYLWTNLRVLGGAYGCMSGFARGGRAYLVSYRDPQITKTNDIYEQLPEYVENWEGDEDTVRKYIIGAISVMDRPLQASAMAITQLSNYYWRMTDAELQKDRDEVLSCTPETIRGFAAYIRALLAKGGICTLGNAAQIEKQAELFKSTRELY
ncbi:MAG: insulinase family protein [Lachnospiraceae bacterium]|nr:insulinase family protein [Lachnospiraceae bacterium]